MKKEMAGEYINAFNAVAALQACQMYFAMKGYLVTSRIDLETQTCELTVHFSEKSIPQLPAGYSCSSYQTESHEYYSEALKSVRRVRTKDFFYTWAEEKK